jgi:putative oxidoreductase
MKSSGLSRLTPYCLSLLRLAAAFVYVAHGTQKLFGVPGHPFHAPVFAMTMFGAAGIIETIGGILMLLGLFTRPVAFILSGQMAVAFFTQHWPRGFWPINNGGELAVVFCFLWLFFSVAGAGPISLDALRGRR